MNDTPKRSIADAAHGNRLNTAENPGAHSTPRNQLVEDLAESVHNAWAAQRLREAWSAGSRSSKDEQRGPALGTYKELSELEKNVERQAAATAVQAMLHLGYTFNDPQQTEDNWDQAVASVLAELRLHRKDSRKLLQLWKHRAKHLWPSSLTLYTSEAEYLCLHGEAFAAIDVCQEGLRYFPGQVRLNQLKAWALAQSGAIETARKLLESLEQRADSSAETHSLLARTWKDVANLENDLDRKRELLKTACQHYEKGYEFSVLDGRPDYYPAINCATLRMRLGEHLAARAWAERAARLAEQEPRTFWAEATLGEAALLLGEIEKAQEHYLAFASECGQQRAAISSARRQAAEILGSKERVREILGACLPLPPVSIFASGVQVPIDNPGATFLCPWTREDAAGVNALIEHGAEVHLILAFPLECYPPELLGLAPSQIEIWKTRATSMTVAHPHGADLTDELAGFCAVLQVGRARRLADTWSAVLHFPQPTELSDRPIRAYQTAMYALHESKAGEPVPWIARSMAFLDVVGYGQLDEPRVAYFQQTVVPNIAAFLRALAAPPMFVQIWGDALYLGFSDVREGGVAVLALRRFFAAIHWSENGFKKPLKLRIAIHSGPVMTAVDPFNGNIYFTGTVVSRAARIEPLTDEDQIFCSDAFAAIASALRVDEFSCAFAGTYLLPKNAGEEPLFRLLPTPERALDASEVVSRRSKDPQ